jgi:hypothetical protein
MPNCLVGRPLSNWRQAEIVREIADYPWHMRQFWVRHPDGYLIRPAQKILSVNPATHRRQVTDAFERDTPRITQELLAVKQTADRLAAQATFSARQRSMRRW